MKRSTRVVNCTKNMLKVQAKEISRSIQQHKQDKIIDNNMKVPRSTPTRFTFELDGNIILQHVRLHPRRGSRTMNGSRIKVGIIGDFQPGLNSKKFKVEIISTERLVAQLNHTTRRDSDKSFFLIVKVFFSLAGNFHFPGNGRGVNRTPSHSACTDAHSVSAQHMAFIPCTTSVAQGNLDCVPKIVFVFRAVSHAVHSTLSTPSSTSPTITGLQRLITSRIPWCT